jgi:hypothetical protein
MKPFNLPGAGGHVGPPLPGAAPLHHPAFAPTQPLPNPHPGVRQHPAPANPHPAVPQNSPVRRDGAHH